MSRNALTPDFALGSQPNSKPRVPKRTRRQQRQRKLLMEQLEDRRLLAVGVLQSDAPLLEAAAEVTPTGKDLLATQLNVDGQLQVHVHIDEYSILKLDSGQQRIQVPGLRAWGDGGNPELPGELFRFALPPDANLSTVSLVLAPADLQALPGIYDLVPAPLAATENDGQITISAASDQIVDGKNMLVYGSDDYYDLETCSLLSTQQMGRWKMAEVFCSPFAYHPTTGEVSVAENLSFEIQFQSGDPLPAELADLTTWDASASEMMANYDHVVTAECLPF